MIYYTLLKCVSLRVKKPTTNHKETYILIPNSKYHTLSGGNLGKAPLPICSTQKLLINKDIRNMSKLIMGVWTDFDDKLGENDYSTYICFFLFYTSYYHTQFIHTYIKHNSLYLTHIVERLKKRMGGAVLLYG